MFSSQSFSQIYPRESHPSVPNTLLLGQVDERCASISAPTQIVSGKRAKKAPTLNAEAWLPHKERVLHLHITEDRSLQEVARMMKEERGFEATERQYRTRITQWKKDKNVKPDEMRAIVRKRQHRKLMEEYKSALHFEVRERPVAIGQIDRWMKSNNVRHDELYDPDTEMATPSAIVCRTISSRGTSVVSPRSTASVGPLSPGSPPQASSQGHPPPDMLSLSELIGSPISSFAGHSPAVTDYSSPVSIMTIDNPSMNQDVSEFWPHAFDQSEFEALFSQYHGSDTDQSTRDQNPLDYVASRYSAARASADRERKVVQGLKQYNTEGATFPEDGLMRMVELADILRVQARYSTATAILRHCILLLQQNPTIQIKVAKEALITLGMILYQEDRYEHAELVFKKVLSLDTNDVVESELEHRLTAMAWLGRVYLFKGKVEEAESISRQTLREHTAVDDGNGYQLMASIRASKTLVDICIDAQRFGEAERIAEPVFEMSTTADTLLLCYSVVLSFASTMSIVYQAQGRYVKAKEFLEKAFASFQAAYGMNHPATMEAMLRLGLFHYHAGNLGEAATMLRSVVSYFRAYYGSQHPETSLALSQLGVVLGEQGEWEEATELGEEALRASRKVCGLQHAQTSEAMANLGCLYQKQRRFEEAYPLLRNALESLRQTYGLDRLCLHRTIKSLLAICHEQERWAEVEKLKELEAGLLIRSRISEQSVLYTFNDRDMIWR